MKADPFLVERFLNTYKYYAELNLAETCDDPFRVGDLLSLVGHEGFLQDLQKDTVDLRLY